MLDFRTDCSARESYQGVTTSQIKLSDPVITHRQQAVNYLVQSQLLSATDLFCLYNEVMILPMTAQAEVWPYGPAVLSQDAQKTVWVQARGGV